MPEPPGVLSPPPCRFGHPLHQVFLGLYICFDHEPVLASHALWRWYPGDMPAAQVDNPLAEVLAIALIHERRLRTPSASE